MTGPLDFSDKIHVGLHSKAIAGLYGDKDADKYDLDPANTQTLLNLVYDRGVNYNISVLQVPQTMAQVSMANPQRINMCKQHGEINRELITAFARTYLNTNTRLAQDDNILVLMIQNSLTKKAYQTITTDRSEYEVDGRACGLMMLKAVLEESAIETSVDPDLIRIEISMAASKFANLNFNVRAFNEWIKLKVSQLLQCGQESTDVKPHIFSAYLSSNDQDFVTYIKTLRDQARDNPSSAFTYKTLMSRAKDKYESIEQDMLRSQVKSPREDPIMALKAELRQHKQVIDKIQKRASGDSKQKKKPQASKKADSKKKPFQSTFPEELKTKGAPADPSKPLEIKGVKYYYCTSHEKWGQHLTSDCRAKDSASKPNSKPSNSGNRAGRAVRALLATITEDKV